MSAGITANNDGSAAITVGGIPAIEISAAGGVTIPDLTSGGVPSGAVFYFAASTAPTGYLEANGAAVSRDTYAALFAVVGTTYGPGNGSTTFNLPDLRGQFLRGWDNGRGVDPARVIGTNQADNIKTGWFDACVFNNASEQVINNSDGTVFTRGTGGTTGYNVGGAVFSRANTRVTIGSAAETRPVNVALLACIKT